MNNSIDTTCGIYSTKVTLVRHDNDDVTIRIPWVKWTQNTGSLAFREVTLFGEPAKTMCAIFDGHPPIINPGSEDEYPCTWWQVISHDKYFLF